MTMTTKDMVKITKQNKTER